MTDSSSSAGLQNGLIGLGQDLVADLGVGNSPVFLAQVKTQLALVAEVQVTLLTLQNKKTTTDETAGRASVIFRVLLYMQCVCFDSDSVFLTHSVGLLSSVNTQVALQGLQVTEAGATGMAGVRLLSCVDQNMGPEVGNLKTKQTKTNQSSH